VQWNLRMIRAAINDFARTKITEVEKHLDRLQERQVELEARIAALDRSEADAVIIPELLRNSPLRKHPEVDRLARLLIPPFEPNHQPGHPSLTPIWARELEESAKTFEFGPEIFPILDDLIRTKKLRQNIIETCRSPASVCFFETRDSDGSVMGHFTEGDRDRFVLSIIMRGPTTLVPMLQVTINLDAAQPFLDVPGFGLPTQWRERVIELLGVEGGRSELFRVLAMWAFLGTPGVATVKQVVTREGRKAQKRGRFTLSAIHSYNKVTLNLPRDIREGGRPTQFSPGPGRRYHDVMAFDRLKRAPPPGSPKLLRWLYAWWFGHVHVRAHHRGNKELGVVTKERKVTAQPPRPRH
jgi:hypothetical protein